MVKDIITIFNKKLAVIRPLLLPNCEGSHSVRLFISVLFFNKTKTEIKIDQNRKKIC